MFKKISVLFFTLMLAGCSSWSSVTNYIPFMGNDKKVIDLDKDKIDQKSIDEQLQKAQEQYGGKDKFEQLLKQQGFTLDKYKDGLKVKAAQTLLINDYAGTNDDKLK